MNSIGFIIDIMFYIIGSICGFIIGFTLRPIWERKFK